MAGNSFGTLFRVTTFGESHGEGIGVVIDGCLPGMMLDMEFVRYQLSRRRPGQSPVTSARKEFDDPEVLSGIYDGKTTGAPLTLFIKNKDQRSVDYKALQNVYRPSHADYTYEAKYGIRDHRGSGRASARETAARVMAGAVAMQLLKSKGVSFFAYVQQIGNVAIPSQNLPVDTDAIDSNEVRCPHSPTAEKMRLLILETKEKGDTLGGIVSGVIKGVPAGLGEPVFDKLHARLGYAMLGINAVKGFEVGSGFPGVMQTGSSQNDVFANGAGGKVETLSNNSGGVQGGISNGMDITFNVAFKPVSTLMMKQQTIDSNGTRVEIEPGGRHDVCVVPRAVPIVESMSALVMMDFWLMQSAIKG